MKEILVNIEKAYVVADDDKSSKLKVFKD